MLKIKCEKWKERQREWQGVRKPHKTNTVPPHPLPPHLLFRIIVLLPFKSIPAFQRAKVELKHDALKPLWYWRRIKYHISPIAM